MVRRVILGVVMASALAVSGCATTGIAHGGAAVTSGQTESSDPARSPESSVGTERFSGGNALVMNVGGSLGDSQDPIPIFPKDPAPAGGMRNPGNPGSSPLPSTNPVASSRR